jgi:DNA-binding NarL/FixJ family response regulator
LGATQRTALQRRAARATLNEALAIFDDLGARPWIAKARDELQRVSGRAPGTRGLTEAERRVAELAAEGRQNKEIATALYIGVGTVESHLSRVYRKLGIRSRTELAARFARDDDGSLKV